MKKLITILRTLGLFLIALGFWFKLHSWPGAAVMLISGFTIIILIRWQALSERIPDGNEATDQKSYRRYLLIHRLVYFSYILVLAGVLFNLQSWSGAGILIWASSLGLILFSPIAWNLAPNKNTLKLAEYGTACFGGISILIGYHLIPVPKPYFSLYFSIISFVFLGLYAYNLVVHRKFY